MRTESILISLPQQEITGKVLDQIDFNNTCEDCIYLNIFASTRFWPDFNNTSEDCIHLNIYAPTVSNRYGLDQILITLVRLTASTVISMPQQSETGILFDDLNNTSEDCLYLNIYAPKISSRYSFGSNFNNTSEDCLYQCLCPTVSNRYSLESDFNNTSEDRLYLYTSTLISVPQQ